MTKKKNLEIFLKELRPFGDVLQAGFGGGEMAGKIQETRPRSHTIIEPDLALSEKIQKWAEKKSNVKIVQEPWEVALSGLGVFDSIAFCGFSSQTLVVGEERFQEVHEKIPSLLKIRYSDADLDSFCKAVDPALKQKLSIFLAELEQNGQIDSDQREEMARKYKLKKASIERFSFPSAFFFLKRCLGSHMRKNSRFAALLEEELPKAAERALFDEIVVNPSVCYREVDLPSGRLILVEKLV